MLGSKEDPDQKEIERERTPAESQWKGLLKELKGGSKFFILL